MCIEGLALNHLNLKLRLNPENVISNCGRRQTLANEESCWKTQPATTNKSSVSVLNGNNWKEPQRHLT